MVAAAPVEWELVGDVGLLRGFPSVPVGWAEVGVTRPSVPVKPAPELLLVGGGVTKEVLPLTLALKMTVELELVPWPIT